MKIRKKLCISIVIKFVLLITMITLSMVYAAYSFTKIRLEKSSKQYIKETTIQTARLVDSKLNQYIQILNQMVDDSYNSNIPSEQFLGNINKKIKNHNFENIVMVDKSFLITYKDGSNFQVDINEEKNKVGYIEEAFKGKPKASNPIIDKQGKMIFSIAVPLRENNEVKNVLLANINISDINEIIQSSKLSKDINIYAIDKFGYLISDENKNLIIQRKNFIENNDEGLTKLHKEMLRKLEGVEHFSNKKEHGYLAFSKIKNSDWLIITNYNEKVALKNAYEIKNSLIIITIIGLIISVIITLLISNNIVKPINDINIYAKELSKYNLSVNLKTKREDEIGQTITNLNNASKEIKGIIDEVKLKCESNINNNEKGLIQLQEVLYNTNQLIKNFEGITSSLEENTAAFEEISASASIIKEDVQVVKNKIKNGVQVINSVSEKASIITNETNKAKSEIINTYTKNKNQLDIAIKQAEKVKEIDMMANAILEIADNTKLLALNASIEAARAGEHGKGFSIVANEIKELSEVSSESVANIKSMVISVIMAVDKLKIAAKELVSIMELDVINDYNKMVKVTENYKYETENIKNLIQEFDKLTFNISLSMDEINKTMMSVAEFSNNININTTNSMENLSYIDDKIKRLDKISRKNNEELLDLKEDTYKFY